MTAAVLESPIPSAKRRRARSLVIRDVDWRTYSRLLKAFDRQRNVRLAYDEGILEIMSPLYRHDRSSRVLYHLIHILTEELDLLFVAAGTTTLRQIRKRKGIEADEIFWIANAPSMEGVVRLDLTIHPPPDLAIEVDITSRSPSRFGIYAALGVPEIWRLDGDDLQFHVLSPSGHYEVSAASLAFPIVTVAELFGFLETGRTSADGNANGRRFRQRVRNRLAGGGASTPSPA